MVISAVDAVVVVDKL